MDLNNKKVAKNIIKLALCIRNASRSDLLLLSAMIQLKTSSDAVNDINFYSDTCDLKDKISSNPHICAVLGIKDKE